MTRPRILDLFCGAGGAAMGYHRAGFDVVGVDSNPKLQNHFPFEFIQADTFDVLRTLLAGGFWEVDGLGRNIHLSDFTALHASPPCQDHSRTKSRWGVDHGTGWMLDAVVEAFEGSGKPWVIENVEGASVQMNGEWVTLCGTAFGLNSRRHRRFGSSFPIVDVPACRHADFPFALGVNGHSEQGHVFRKWQAGLGRTPLHADRCDAMGIDWMNRNELAQSIPPVFAEFVGRQLMQCLDAGTCGQVAA